MYTCTNYDCNVNNFVDMLFFPQDDMYKDSNIFMKVRNIIYVTELGKVTLTFIPYMYTCIL